MWSVVMCIAQSASRIDPTVCWVLGVIHLIRWVDMWKAEEEHTVTSSGFPKGKAKNNSDASIPLDKLFGPIEIEGH